MSCQSGVKLAPPIFTASVISFEKRTSDNKVWYTIEVVPKADIITSRSGVKHPVNRSPYGIFRRHEDFCEFAQRLNNKFPRIYQSSHHEKGDLHVYSESISVPSRSTLLSKSLSAPQLYTQTAAGVQTDQDSSESDSIVSLPKIKPLRWTLFRGNRAAFANKRNLFNRFVKALFQLPEIITNSPVVVEFFGIWKEDVDYKLARNMNDPVALSTPMFKILVNLDRPTSQKFGPKRNRKRNSQQDSDEDHSGRAIETVPFSGSALWIAPQINLFEEEDTRNALSNRNSLNEMAYSANDGFDEQHHQRQRQRRRSGILMQTAGLSSLEYSEKTIDENDATLDERGFQPSFVTSNHVIHNEGSSHVHDPDYFSLKFERRTSFSLTPLAQFSPTSEYNSSALGRRNSIITDQPTYENLKTFRSSFSNTSSTFSTPRSILSEYAAQHRPWLPRHSTFGTCQPGLQADYTPRSFGNLMSIVDSKLETPSDDSFVVCFPIPSPVPIHLRIDSNTPNPNALNIKVILDSDTTIILEVPRDISLRRLRARIAAKLARSGYPSLQDDFVLFYNNTVGERTLPDFSLLEQNDSPVNQQACEERSGEPCEKAPNLRMDSHEHCRLSTNIDLDCHIHVSDKSGNPTLEYNPSDGYEDDDIKNDNFISSDDHSTSPSAPSNRLSGFLITKEEHLRLAIRSCWIEGQITLRCIL
ncbi:hypothetical protein BC937DRAFT_94360 [Endogone sp. FLAS-F59071]|nr:hypothetical protein BC937DRAFT_94360 [Endogone sp. FLAS-F59071]|eukprot:RUS14085.1 hypothetical protein BC937DRAFT_94360 [Endogone sp. FLAS-F59071]